MKVKEGQIWLDAWGDEVVVESVDYKFVLYSFRHKNGELDKAYYTTTNFEKHHEFVRNKGDVSRKFEANESKEIIVKADGLKIGGSDLVNNPAHYKSDPSGIECIQISENWSFCLGNALKYLWRNGKKDGEPSIKDLEKAKWYIEREIDRQKRINNK